MGHTKILLLLTFLTPCRVLVQNETCTAEAPMEDDDESASKKEEDGREAAMPAGVVTTANGSSRGRKILGIISSASTEGAFEVEVLHQSNTT